MEVVWPATVSASRRGESGAVMLAGVTSPPLDTFASADGPATQPPGARLSTGNEAAHPTSSPRHAGPATPGRAAGGGFEPRAGPGQRPSRVWEVDRARRLGAPHGRPSGVALTGHRRQRRLALLEVRGGRACTG